MINSGNYAQCFRLCAAHGELPYHAGANLQSSQSNARVSISSDSVRYGDPGEVGMKLIFAQSLP